jgi:hypothetical protein
VFTVLLTTATRGSDGTTRLWQPETIKEWELGDHTNGDLRLVRDKSAKRSGASNGLQQLGRRTNDNGQVASTQEEWQPGR